MSLYATTVSKTSTVPHCAPTASTSLVHSGVSTVRRSPFTVRSALFNATSTYRYIALRYIHEFQRDVYSTTLKVWQDGFFQRTSLQELGLIFYLGHQHTACPLAKSSQQILVIDMNGIHHLSVQFCACEDAPGWVDHYRQLLRMRWYPATFDRPQTAFTFDLLNTYHKLTLQGKLNLYDFYSSIVQKTDNCGRKKPIVSLPTITWVQWLTRAPFLVPVSPDLKIRSSVASFETNQTRWRCPSPHGFSLRSGWGVCTRVPSVPPSRQKPTSRLGTSPRRYKVHLTTILRASIN
jgi:hypothetical protein